jgi:hypothetical protein
MTASPDYLKNARDEAPEGRATALFGDVTKPRPPDLLWQRLRRIGTLLAAMQKFQTPRRDAIGAATGSVKRNLRRDNAAARIFVQLRSLFANESVF